MHGVIWNRKLVLGELCFAVLCSLFFFPFATLAAPGTLTSHAEISAPSSPTALEPITISLDLPLRQYLPLLPNCYTTPAGIYGYVTKAGVPAGGIPVTLKLRDQFGEHQKATFITNSCGYFSFYENILPIDEGSAQGYFVEFDNNSKFPDSLLQWKTKQITSYAVNEVINISNFDIGDITLLYPITSDPAITLPDTFSWTKRTHSPTDSYILRITDTSFGEKFLSNPLGFVNSVAISKNDLPPGMVPNAPYYWYLWIVTADGAKGTISRVEVVKFLNPLN